MADRREEGAARLEALGLDAILIINVKSFVERRRHVEAQLARFGLSGDFVHEFDADEITAELDQRYFAGDELNGGRSRVPSSMSRRCSGSVSGDGRAASSSRTMWCSPTASLKE